MCVHKYIYIYTYISTYIRTYVHANTSLCAHVYAQSIVRLSAQLRQNTWPLCWVRALGEWSRLELRETSDEGVTISKLWALRMDYDGSLRLLDARYVPYLEAGSGSLDPPPSCNPRASDAEATRMLGLTALTC